LNNFILIRHGEANYNLAEERQLIGGVRDWVPLTKNGVKQIIQLCETLKDTPANLIISSPMTRAMHTAAILSQGLSLPLTVEFDLHEWLPDLTFRYNSSAQALASYDELLALGGEWPEGEPRNWEPMSALRKRVHHVLQRYRQYNNVFVVCHGAIIHELHGKPIEVSQYCNYQLSK